MLMITQKRKNLITFSKKEKYLKKLKIINICLYKKEQLSKKIIMDNTSQLTVKTNIEPVPKRQKNKCLMCKKGWV